MNKYLEKYNTIIDELAKETQNGNGYELMTRFLIADEFDNYFGQTEYENLNLTAEQEEIMIEIIHDLYLHTDAEQTLFECTKAVCNTLLTYNNFENFYNEYNSNREKVYENFVWNLD